MNISLEFDLNTGNYDVLLANIGVLTASSFLVTIAHARFSILLYALTTCLGFLFLMNQVDELFSFLSLSSAEEIGMVLLCLYVHLSHLVLASIFFVKLLFRSSAVLNDTYVHFVSAYWHLVEVVWIAILFFLVGF